MKIAIIGAGNMGSAIARGISKGSIFKADDIHVSDPSAKSLEQIKAFNPNIKTFQANKDAIRGTDIVLLAVKPWLVGDVAKEIADDLTEEQILISIAAGVSIAQLQELFAKKSLFRIVPNTAIDVLQSVNIIATANTTEEQQQLVMNIFNELGKSYFVPETQLNSLMSLSSCGIAYAFRYIRAATEGGVEMGIYPEVAKQVVLQTLRGAIELLEKNNTHPEAEIDKVTTPGGITIKGLNEMEANGFTNSVIKGLKASLIK